MSTKPASVPSAFNIPAHATQGPTPGPNIFAAASANGAEEVASSDAGARPMMAALVTIYMSAANATPATVASGTLRSGFSTTAAATDALSSPVNAQNTSTSEFGTA